MSYEFTGRVVHIGRTEQVSDNFKKRDLVVATEGQRYEQQPKFQFSQNSCDMLDNLAPGDRVTVTFDLSGRKGKRKDGSEDWFTNLDAWKLAVVERVNSQDKTKVFDRVEASPKPAVQATHVDDNDDVPF